jgi:hypothetical protein
VTIALAAGLLAGCGGDDDEAATGAATTDEASGDEASGDEASGDEASGDEVDAFCAEAEGVIDSFADLQGVREPTPELFQEVSDAFGTLADEAPEEIRADMDTLVAGLSALGDVLEDLDPEDPASLTALTEEIQRLEEEEGTSIQEASGNVEAYLGDECGIDLGEEAGQATEDPAADGTEDDEPSEEG